MNLNLNNKKIFLVFNLTFWFLILFLIIRIVKFKINFELFYHISLFPLAIAFTFRMLFAWIKGIRFAYILDSENYLKSYGVSGMYALSNSVFPGGIGEAMLPVYVKKYLQLPFSKGTALLLATRVFDILFVMMFFIISFFANNLSVSNINITNLFGLFLIVLIFLTIFLIFFYGRARSFVIKGIKKFAEKRKFIMYSLVRKFILFIEKIDSELSHINSKKRGMIAFLTLISRISAFISLLFLFRSFNLNVSIIQIIFISTFITLMLIIPFQGVGGFGSYEIWVTLALLAVGVHRNQALSVSIPTQLLTFLFGLIEGMLGYVFLIVADKIKH